MKTIDLGYKNPYLSAGLTAPSNPEEGDEKQPQTVYPSFSVRDNPSLVKQLESGQEITATVKLRVCEVRDRSGGGNSYPGDSKCNVEFEVLEMTPKGIEVDSEPSGSDEKTAADALDEFESEKDGGEEE